MSNPQLDPSVEEHLDDVFLVVKDYRSSESRCEGEFVTLRDFISRWENPPWERENIAPSDKKYCFRVATIARPGCGETHRILLRENTLELSGEATSDEIVGAQPNLSLIMALIEAVPISRIPDLLGLTKDSDKTVVALMTWRLKNTKHNP